MDQHAASRATGVFGGTPAARDLFQRYGARLAFRTRVLGGVPKDPQLVESWLRAKAGIRDEDELRHAWLRTLLELGLDVSESISFDEAIDASKKLAGSKVTTGFKLDTSGGLYLESRQVKAGLRENVNVLYGGSRMGPTRKSPRSFVAERVFVTPERLYLDRREPDGVELMIGHLTGPQGPRSVLSYHEYVEAPAGIDFTVLVAEDAIPQEWWPRVWTLFEHSGLGAARSQGYGTFDLVQCEHVAASAGRRATCECWVRQRAGIGLHCPLAARCCSRAVSTAAASSTA